MTLFCTASMGTLCLPITVFPAFEFPKNKKFVLPAMACASWVGIPGVLTLESRAPAILYLPLTRFLNVVFQG
jgi:hypothetical protein